ncbi:DinB family protein [Acidipropionibacterium acidipropionici]|uniref:DinB family protein n=1 Tax=Acidipropionibacterium acidipropionici TaxID=1748 RepID=UPI00110B4D6C|nr:DinB family protein [Acidipropionibacterium acidipropionici]QCV95269.1 DinB family protein [Acidipropionibacterium acidipropionici]
MTTTSRSWPDQLAAQLRWHWDHQLSARLAGLTDEEYFWEPVADCWSVRPRGTGTAQMQAGSGAMTIDFAFPEPSPAPFTTIAWRLDHVIVGVLGARNGVHFGHEQVTYDSFEYAPTATQALAQLEREYRRWTDGVAAMSEDEFWAPCGPGEGGWADHPMAELVLHINREVIHHLSEVCLLRDLHLHTIRQDAS